MKHNVWKLISCNKVIFGPNVDKTPSEGDASITTLPPAPLMCMQIKLKRLAGVERYILEG